MEEEIEARNEKRSFDDHESKKAKNESGSRTIVTFNGGVGSIDRCPFNGLTDVTKPTSNSQTAFFWQIPKTGGKGNSIYFFTKMVPLCLKSNLDMIVKL